MDLQFARPVALLPPLPRTQMSRSQLFPEIPAFSNFNNLTLKTVYHPVPGDWWFVVADIEGSTVAIKGGRYRDVNTLWAACIAAAQNAMGRIDFLYVFGGDGATLLVPPENFEVVSSALDGVRTMAMVNYDMCLRVGAVSVATVRDEGRGVEVARYREGDELRIARYQLFDERSTAMFRGGGITLAENLIKADPQIYGIWADPKNAADLTGLSCRWKPLPVLKRQIVSLLVSAREAPSVAIFERVLKDLNEILGSDIESANPINGSQLGYKSLNEVPR
jgi:hypothetical protein